MNSSLKYFDPETLARIRPLGLRARTLVEGLMAGMHRSPLRGQSLEFSQHREYVPGDDLRQVDWKVFARSDKHYVRQYEDESNLSATLLLDQSASMDYRSNPRGLSKLEYAQLVACSLIFLITAQQDAAAAGTFTTGLDQWLPASSRRGQLDDLIRLLELPPPTDRQSNLAAVLDQCAGRLTKRNLVVLLSDLLDDPAALLKGLQLLHCAGHDILVLHILDPWEVQFPFERTSQFEGLESADSLTIDPWLIAGGYRRAMADLCRQLQLGCLRLGGEYYRLSTDQSLAAALPELLSRRLARRS